MLLYSPVYLVLIALLLTLLKIQSAFFSWKEASHKAAGRRAKAATEAHAQCLHYAVPFIPLLIATELTGASNDWIAVSSVTFLAGRVLHGSYLMSESWPKALVWVASVLSHGASLALMGRLVWALSTIPS